MLRIVTMERTSARNNHNNRNHNHSNQPAEKTTVLQTHERKPLLLARSCSFLSFVMRGG